MLFLKTRDRLVSTLLYLLLSAAWFIATPGWCHPKAPGTAAIIRVVDGDTLEVQWERKREHLRLIGVDTPESKENRLAGSQAERSGRDVATIINLGKRAAIKTSELAPQGTSLRLEFDAGRRDRYGRLLAYAYLPNGAMLNNELVRLGYAQTMTVPPNVRYAKRFAETMREARQAKRGFWGQDGF